MTGGPYTPSEDGRTLTGPDDTVYRVQRYGATRDITGRTPAEIDLITAGAAEEIANAVAAAGDAPCGIPEARVMLYLTVRTLPAHLEAGFIDPFQDSVTITNPPKD